MSDSSQTTLTDYLRVLRRSRWLILAVIALCALIAVAYVVIKTPKYDATAAETISDPGAALQTVTGQGSITTLPLQLASAHAPDVTRPEVVADVKKKLGLSGSIDDVRSLVSIEVDPNAYTVNITATDSNADDAAAIANAFADSDASISTAQQRARYARQATALERKLKKSFGTTTDPTAVAVATQRISILQGLSTTAQPVSVSSAAQVPTSASSPKPFRDIGAALVIGIILGIAIAYARSLFDRRLRDSGAVEQVFGYPVLARLRHDVFGHTGSATDAETEDLGPLEPVDSESFRMLRENLRYLAIDRDLRKIVVTSAVPEEGKSTVAACLAMAFAGAGKRTLLVECDLRKRVLAERLGIEEAPGLSDYLAGRASPAEILQQVPVPGGSVEHGIDVAWAEGDNGSAPQSLVTITAGSAPPRPADILSSERFSAFLQQVGKVYERVIIDSPPLLPVADTLEIVPNVDCMLLCVRLNRTTRDQAQAAQEALQHLPDRPVGLVITDLAERDTGYYGGYYHSAELAVPEDGPANRKLPGRAAPPRSGVIRG